MKESKVKVTSNITFGGLLTITFIVLKLLNVIKWSWWWVLCPVWIPILIALIVLGLYFAVVVKHK